MSSLFVTPLLSLVIVALPISPPDLNKGLAIFFGMPCTINSALVFTKIVDGDVPLAGRCCTKTPTHIDTLSVLLTVATNTLAVFTIPFMLPFVTNADGDARIELDAVGMITDLCLSIIVPLAVGKAARYVRQVRDAATKYSVPLKHVSSLALILVRECYI